MAFQALNVAPVQEPPGQLQPPILHQQQLVPDALTQAVTKAFELQPSTAQAILQTAQPSQYELFQSISQYVLSLRTELGACSQVAQEAKTAAANTEAIATKKRKLDVADDTNGQTAHPSSTNAKAVRLDEAIQDARTTLDCRDVSFAVPARKKLRLQLVADSANSARRELRVLNQQTGNLEYILPASAIDHAFSLPVPEKAARQRNFVLIPREGSIDAAGNPLDQFVFAQNEVAIKDNTILTLAATAVTSDDNFASVTERSLQDLLSAVGKTLVLPSATEFASSIPQSHRKGEKAYHVKAHKGSKEGYLFFLANGILFGFKKPLIFFPFSSIESTSYTSVLQRTFNLVITATSTSSGDGGELVEHEFSMLDQADFAGIDEYVKGHGLNDASMAAERRAKAYNVNRDKREKANGDGDQAISHEEEQSELQKAQQALEDAEDEEEEDYDPSGGESEGEGEDSEEEGDGDAMEGEYGEDDDELDGEEVEDEKDAHDD
ncbi:Rtt106-domain-containing protein [Polychaeton citri CBS 116435]|uniref:Rtt106-domain-containing protein n=1 Tax=Polychaeton citri CBS 116435 TaxID=1314669 RepID=A0A9P4UNN6_9PEZI|nr:Rtt106-domain-containing protein [Polychaeton citri CBS 116435]